MKKSEKPSQIENQDIQNYPNQNSLFGIFEIFNFDSYLYDCTSFWNKKSYWAPNQNDLFNGTEVNFFPQGNNIKKLRSILKEE